MKLLLFVTIITLSGCTTTKEQMSRQEKYMIENFVATPTEEILLKQQKSIIENIRSKGEVLKEYQKNDDYFLLIKDGDKYIKYRVYFQDNTITTQHGNKLTQKFALSATQYIFDSLIKSCFALNVVIDCNKLKEDPDFLPYLKDIK